MKNMIRKVEKENLSECTQLIKQAFLTVAQEFSITESNAPGYVAFSVHENKLLQQFNEGRKMYAYFDDNKMIGFYSLVFFDEECELNNLCVLPAYRHKCVGKALLLHSFKIAKLKGCKKINISIVEENKMLRDWYIKFGFVPLYTKKFDFFPFTCGYMKKDISNE